MKVLWLLLCAILPAVTSQDSHRLPTNLIPVHYDLKVIARMDEFDLLNLDTYKFSAEMNITLLALEPNINKIVLNAFLLTFTDTVLYRKSDLSSIPVDNIAPPQDELTQTITYTLPNGALNASEDYILSIKYEGSHRLGFGYGFYDVSTVDSRFVLSFQFKPVYARYALPCYDEPSFRAKWNINVSIPNISPNYIVYSNAELSGPPIVDPTNSSRNLYILKETPEEIPTYLLSLLISDYAITDPVYFTSDYSTAVGDKPFRTVARDINLNLTDFSQTLGPQALSYFTDRFGVGYALPKMEQAGVDGFSAEGLENWGLVLYSDNYLFMDVSEDYNLELLAMTTVSMMVKQWFSNLVALHWWSDIWLNEAFSAYFETYATPELSSEMYNFEDLDLPGSLLVESTQGRAMFLDADYDTTPLTNSNVQTHANIIGAYLMGLDREKGAAVVRMLTHILGLQVFNDGLHNYLEARQLSVGTPEDLTSAFQLAVNNSETPPNLGGVSVEEIFSGWHLQPGYPVVTVQSDSSGALNLSQAQFFDIIYEIPPPISWYIPITYSSNSDLSFETNQQSWLVPGDDLSLNIGAVEWFVVNNQETGYYRVNYNEDNWRALTTKLSDNASYTDIHVYNRAQLIDDSMSLAESTSFYYLDPEIALNLTNYLSHEESYLPHRAFDSHNKRLKSRFGVDSQLYQNYKRYITQLYEKHYNNMGFNNDYTHYTDKKLSALVTSLMCEVGYKDCLDTARKLFKEDIERYSIYRSSALTSTLRQVVYCYGIKTSGPEEWHQLWNFSLLEKNKNIQKQMLAALGCSTDKMILKLYLQKLLDETIAPKLRLLILKSIFLEKVEIIDDVYTFLTSFLNVFTESFSENDVGDFGKVLSEVSQQITNKSHLQMLTDLKTKMNHSKQVKHQLLLPFLDRCIKNINKNMFWIDRKLPLYKEWFQKYEATITA